MIHHEYSIAGHNIETPLVNSAGSINGTSRELVLREVDILASTAIGAITVGSFTVPRQEGNDVLFGSPTYFHDTKTATTYNSMGLPNIGLLAAKELMPEILKRAHEKGKPVIASVASTLHSRANGDSFEQLERLIYEMQLTGVDMIEVSPGSPNTITPEGGRKSLIAYDYREMEELIARLAQLDNISDSSVGLKLPPYTSDEQKNTAIKLATLINRWQTFEFIVTANTIPNQLVLNEKNKPVLAVPSGEAGMCGPSTKEVGREQLRLWRELLDDSIDIVSTLGLDSGKELAVRCELGASATGGVTFLWESDNWGRAVSDIISDWVDEKDELNSAS